ncbi:MAG: META domain-containing protein [bacterium]
MDQPALTGRWRVVEVGGAAVADDPEAAGPQAEVQFAADGDATGSTGVNRFRSRYTLTDDVLSFTPLAMTRMAGPPEAMAGERAIVAALEAGGNVQLVARDAVTDLGDELFVTSAGGRPSDGLRLRRLAPPAPTPMID